MTPSTLPATKGVTEALAEALRIGQSYVLDAMRNDGGIENCEIGYRTDFEKVQVALRALASLPLLPPGEGEAPTWREFDHETIAYVLRYGGRCRECADHHGLCPNGLPCDVDDAKTAIRWVLKALNYGIGNGFLPSPALSQPQPDEMQPDKYTGGDFNGVVRGKMP